ncbi:MAG TPA: hypothetical protein VKE26_18620, partial [Xanthobacteraceae bacterium]|nr:hypothetical protein [Xanthobacteraceae bacterium]
MRIANTMLATTAALALLAMAPVPAAAGSAEASLKPGVITASADELSARKRHYRHYRSGNAAAARAFGAIAGTVGGIIADQQARSYYRRHYYPYGPYGGYGYYGAPYGYG